MVLHRKNGKFPMTESFIRSVIEVGVCYFNRSRVEGIRINGKPVVLRSDFNLAGQEVFHRMVRSTM